MKKGVLHKEDSILHKLKFHRVVLDESHNIKDRQSNQAKAAFALQSKFKWCLSGTPLQNRVGELYSLIRFLGVDPFAFYYCKRCDCKSLHWLSVKVSLLDASPCSLILNADRPLLPRVRALSVIIVVCSTSATGMRKFLSRSSLGERPQVRGKLHSLNCRHCCPA